MCVCVCVTGTRMCRGEGHQDRGGILPSVRPTAAQRPAGTAFPRLRSRAWHKLARGQQGCSISVQPPKSWPVQQLALAGSGLRPSFSMLPRKADAKCSHAPGQAALHRCQNEQGVMDTAPICCPFGPNPSKRKAFPAGAYEAGGRRGRRVDKQKVPPRTRPPSSTKSSRPLHSSPARSWTAPASQW